MLNSATYSMGLTDNDHSPKYINDSLPYWKHYHVPNQYPTDNTQAINFMVNPLSDYAIYDTNIGPPMNLANDWNACSLNATQSSLCSNFPSQNTDASDSPIPVTSRRESTVTQLEEPGLKRVAEPKEKPTRKQPRRASTKKVPKDEPVPEPRSKAKPKAKSKAKQVFQEDIKEPEPAPRSSRGSSVASSSERKDDDITKRIQERNRIASNKFRIKKREDAAQLRINERDLKEANRDLSRCVADLTLEVYTLKMRLLQHTDCDCHLIQSYIASEAQRYIKDLGDEQMDNSPSGQHQMRCPAGTAGVVE